MEAPESELLKSEGSLAFRPLPPHSEALDRIRVPIVHLLEDFTALENVLMPAKILRRSASRKEGLELLASVDLSHRADFPVKLLSGGEKQRVAIARALCNDPALILADEPSGNLDAANALIVGDLLLSLVRERKKSLILATHDTRLASLCGKTYLLNGGKLYQE